MSSIRLTLALRDEYEMLFQSCAIRPGALDEATRRATQIGEHRSRYQAIADACLVPWYLIGIIAFDAEGTPAAEPESSIWARFEGLRYGPQRVDERARELAGDTEPDSRHLPARGRPRRPAHLGGLLAGHRSLSAGRSARGVIAQLNP